MAHITSTLDLTQAQQLELMESCYQIASEEAVYGDRIEISDLARYLYDHAEDWASFDEEDMGDESYELVIASYYDELEDN